LFPKGRVCLAQFGTALPGNNQFGAGEQCKKRAPRGLCFAQRLIPGLFRSWNMAAKSVHIA
jgi:hypothetical protein